MKPLKGKKKRTKTHLTVCSLLQRPPASSSFPDDLLRGSTLTFWELASEFRLFFVAELEHQQAHTVQKGPHSSTQAMLKPTPSQPILSRELGRSRKTLIHHFTGVLLRICSFPLMQIWAKFTFPGQMPFLLHLHAVSLLLFSTAFYCQARSNDLLASPPLKAEKLLFPPCLWMIK